MVNKIITPNQGLGAKAPVSPTDPFEKRKEAFAEEVDKIGNRYLIGIVPKLVVTRDGIAPVLTFVDRTEPKTPPESVSLSSLNTS